MPAERQSCTGLITCVAGASVGGVNPLFIGIKPESKYDSWITVGITDGDPKRNLGSIGLNMKKWNENSPLFVNNGAVFWLVSVS